MAIGNDWFVDYQNKLIVHATYSLDYDGQSSNFNIGATVTSSSGGTAVIVNDTDGGATGTLDLVYVNGTFADDDTLADDGPTPGAAVENGTLTAKTTVYTARALYSFIQNTFDELVQMDDTIPMSAQTPTEFTMINGWFIDDESTKYLSGGAISTSGYLAEIQVLTLSSSDYTSANPASVGEIVTVGGSTVGALLHYNNTTRKWWVRYGSTINNSSAIALSSGTGGGVAASDSTSGEDLYANIYTLGSITTDPNPKTYVFQNGSAISEWWGRGDVEAHIDVLIKVKEASAEIDGANITVFTRHFADLYDHFPIDLSSGGRQAVPLATSTDLNNNVSGEITVEYENLAGGTFTVGNFVRDETTGAYGEILADASSVLTVGNVIIGTGGSGDFTATNGISETTTGLAAGDTGVTADIVTDAVTAVVRGYSDIKILFMNITLPFTSGSLEPSVGDALEGATSTAVAYYISSTVSTGSWTGGDAEGTMYLANWDSTNWNASETINNTTLGSPAGDDIADTNGTETVTATVNKNFEQGDPYPYNVVVQCANRTMAQVYEWFKYITREDANSTQINYQTMYRVSGGSSIVEEDGEEYIAAQSTYSPVKASPLGTLAGGKLFGARGVWVEGMATADRQNFQLIDSNGTTRTPPNFITITVTSVLSSDKVTVFRTSSGTTINKSQFSSGNDNTQSGTSFTVQGTIPSDTPNSGNLRVVDTSDTSVNREKRYAYSSWTSSTFTLSGSTTLDRTYSAGEDTAYVPYYDEIAGNTSVYVTVIYSADQSVLTRVRRYGGAGDSILPFEIAGNVISTGYTVAAIRTSDTIVT